MGFAREGASKAAPSRRVPLLDSEQLDLEEERGVGRDDPARPARAVAEGRRDEQVALSADLHRRDPLVPPLDDRPLAESELEGLAPVHGAVELGALRAV